MIRWRDGACRRYRPDLLEVVVDGTRSPSAPAAFDHLHRCHRCETQLTDIALLVTSLRRRGELARSVTARPDAWERLLARVERTRAEARRVRWLGRLRLGGSMVSALLVAVVVWPASTGSKAQPAEAGYRSPALIRDLQAEAAFIAAVGVGNRTHRPAHRGGSIIVNYPDGIRPVGKEVNTKRIERPPMTAT